MTRLPELAACLLLSAAAGWLASLLFDSPLVDAIVNAVVIGTPLICFERGLLFPRLRILIRGMATPIYLGILTLAFVGTSLGGHVVAGLLLSASGLSPAPVSETAAFEPGKLVYGFVALGAIILTFRVRELIGPTVFRNLMLGRYHRPVTEERLFLFLDLAGSTRFAEQHGDVRAQEFLGRAFGQLAGPVRRHGGSIDDYIGDMAMVTWPLARGTRRAAAVACVFDFLDEIDREASEWRRRFGEVPRFRAALHGGPVVTAEIGLDRHKITYFGDVVNTTSRIESLGKSLGEAVLVSADLLGRFGRLPDGIVARDLGSHALRGRRETIAVAALGRGKPTADLAAEALAPRSRLAP